MLTIALTRHPHARKELFLGKTLRVISRSGLNPTEAALIEALPTLKPPPEGCFISPLFLGGRTGALPMALWLTRGDMVTGRMTIQTFDAHTLATLRRNLSENRVPEEFIHPEAQTDICGLARTSTFVFWQMTKGDGTAERDLDTLEQLFDVPENGSRRFLIAAEELNDTLVKRFRKHCDKVSLSRQGPVTLLYGILATPIPEAKQTDRRATFEVSLKGHAPITLETCPGCFCHRRADMGGLALTEVVAEQVAFDVGDRVMDMGCGCGMDGILLATAFPEKKLRIDYQDSNLCAWAATQANLSRYPHAARFFFSAEGEGDPAAYDLFLANPPYFGDWRIAEFFIQTAARLLKPGGLLAFVSKREAKPLELMAAAGFEHLNTFTRRGYTILLVARR